MVADLIGGPLLVMPERGRLALVDEMALFPGGCAVNTGIALSRLGLPVELIGRVGFDALGDFLVSALKGSDVGVDGVQRDAVRGTSATMVMIDPDGERRFVHHIGANAGLSAEDVDQDTIGTGAILHVGGCLILPGLDGAPLAGLLRDAQAAGLITTLDTAWDTTGRWMELLAPCLPYVDYFVPSLAEGRAMTGLDEPECVTRALLEAGAGTVALKMGAEGSVVMTQDGRIIRTPAYEVEVVDTTGAGDAFAAGFIAGVYHGWSLEKTVRLANAVGALCVTGSGAAGGVTTLEETIRFVKSREKSGQDSQDLQDFFQKV